MDGSRGNANTNVLCRRVLKLIENEVMERRARTVTRTFGLANRQSVAVVITVL